MLIKLFTLYVYLQAALCGCGPDKRHSDFVRLRKAYQVKVTKIGRLDRRIAESSGLAAASDSTFWTHGDGGSASALYLVNLQGKLLQTLPLPIANQDWEELMPGKSGHLYIGDFGNNANTRQNLQVYQVLPETGVVTDTIRFRYADQAAFPPPRERRNFDTEASFFAHDSLYLFTKSRALWQRQTTRYSLPAKAGRYDLAPQESLRLNSPLTAAALSPDQQQFALLGYGRLYLFGVQPETGISFNGQRFCLPLGRTGQAEAILYLSPQALLLTNEKGTLYLVTLHRRP